MLCRKKPTALKRRFRRYACFILAAVIAFAAYFELAVRTQLSGVIVAELKASALDAVNGAVADFLTENPDAGERLSTLSFSDSGTVAAVTTDSAYINYVKSDIARRAQAEIDRTAHAEGIEVPFGSFTGLVLISELGPRFRLSIDGRCSVGCKLESRLDSAGVNQTVHHISMTVEAAMAVCSPFRIKEPVKVSADFEIAQSVIVGSVPSYSGLVTY